MGITGCHKEILREGDRYVTDLESGDRLMGVHIGQTSPNGTPYVCIV